jgi:SAM-dependent methyltransferase
MDRQKVLNDGERIIGDEEDWNAKMHRAQYGWVVERVKLLNETYTFGRAWQRYNESSVLDFGCGSGYGTRLLIDGTFTRVFGSDVDVSAIEWATEHHSKVAGHNPFSLVTRPPLAHELVRQEIDIVVCMGVLEHLPLRPWHYILEWLKAGVSIIGSVPLAEPPGRNPYHYHHSLQPGDILPQEEAAGLDVEWFGFVALEEAPRPLAELLKRPELFEGKEDAPHVVSLLFCITPKKGAR